MINFDLHPETEKKLKFLLSSSKNPDTFFNEIIENKISELQIANKNIEKELNKLEMKNDLDSITFFSQLNNKKINPTLNTVIWSGIYKLYLNNNFSLKKLL